MKRCFLLVLILFTLHSFSQEDGNKAEAKGQPHLKFFGIIIMITHKALNK